MKRDLEHLDLKQAFHPVPEACRRALMDAARSVREEKPVKRVSYRAALIAAVILLAAMAVAYAAVRLGWIDYYDQQYGIAVPRAAQEALEASQRQDAVEILARRPHKRFALQILVASRRLADDVNFGVGVSGAEQDVGAGAAQIALFAHKAGLL